MLTLLCAVAGTMWGSSPYTHTFAQSDFTSTTENGTKYFTLTQDVTLSNVDWKLELTPKSGGDKVYMGNVHDTKGLQFGSGNYPASSIKLSTSGISGTIKSVTVNTSGASGISGTVKVSVSGTSYECDIQNSLTTTATNYKFSGSASGKILIEWSQTSSKAIYIKDVTIEYEGGSTITVAAPTFSPAAGAVKEGTVVTITSPDAASMRFTVDDGEPSTVTGGRIEHTVNKATTLKAVAIDAYGNESEEVVASYTIVPQGVQTATIDFEKDVDSYTDWTFTDMESKATNSNVTPHGGSYFGKTGGKTSASIGTKERTNPISITFYVTRQSTNTSSSTWKIQTSTNGSNWTDVKDTEVSAIDMAQGTWKEVTADLSSYKNVYVRIYYSGSTAIRNIDDVQLVYRPLKKIPELSWSETTIEMNIGETREIPDFICPEGVARTNMMSSNNDVVTFDAVQNPDNTYTILLVAQAVGTATITGYTDETSEYEAGEASFTVTVVDPTHVEVTATYLFEQNTTPVNDYGSGVTVTSGANDYIGDPTKKTWTSGAVTLETDGKYRWKTNSSGNPPTDLRFHNQDKEDKPQSYMKFSVPSGSLITKIVMTGFDYNLWAVDCGNYSSGTWTGNSQEVTFAWPEGKTSGNIQVQTVTVTYTTPSTEEPVIWMSYSSANNLDFTGKTDYTAYIATSYRAEEGVVGLTKIEKVPSGEGILIKSNDSSKAIKDIFKESDVPANEPITTQITQMLVGAPAGVEYLLPEEGDYTNFVLAKREGVVGFYKVAQQGALASNKAYLQIPTASLTSTSGANGITFVEDGATAIQSVTTATTDDAWYTLQGVRVAQPTRGLYIHNGKKVVVK